MNRDFKYNPKIESNLWESVKDLIYRLLEPKPEKRITAKEIISQKWIN
jgi:serine/threonine protein kinase